MLRSEIGEIIRERQWETSWIWFAGDWKTSDYLLQLLA
jgi:hypothetical protein